MDQLKKELKKEAKQESVKGDNSIRVDLKQEDDAKEEEKVPENDQINEDEKRLSITNDNEDENATNTIIKTKREDLEDNPDKISCKDLLNSLTEFCKPSTSKPSKRPKPTSKPSKPSKSCPKPPKPSITSPLTSPTCYLCQHPLPSTSPTTITNPSCQHQYHTHCLQSNTIALLHSITYPFRCPTKPCRRQLPRPLITSLISPHYISYYDTLHFINRLEKGKRVLLYCSHWKVWYSVLKKGLYGWKSCEGMGVNVREVLAWGYRDEVSDGVFDQVKEQTERSRLRSQKMGQWWMDCKGVLKDGLEWCEGCTKWRQDFLGAENFRWRCGEKRENVREARNGRVRKVKKEMREEKEEREMKEEHDV